MFQNHGGGGHGSETLVFFGFFGTLSQFLWFVFGFIGFLEVFAWGLVFLVDVPSVSSVFARAWGRNCGCPTHFFGFWANRADVPRVSFVFDDTCIFETRQR